MTDLLAATTLSTLADGPLFGLPLAKLWFGLIFAVLGTFLFLDGFDFGVGALFATRTTDAEREQLLAAIGPFWDGNEVWLVVFGGMLFAVFPTIYADLFSRHYLLMFGILAALILRGLAPEMYEQRHDEAWQRWWGRSFVVGSVTAPLFLGIFTGNWLFGVDGFVSVASLLVGLAVVALTIVDGAAYLGVKTRGDVRSETRAMGLLAQVVYLLLAVAAVVVGSQAVEHVTLLSVPVLALLGATVLLAATYAVASRLGRWYVAFVAVAGQVYGLVALVATLLYPMIDPVTGLAVGEAIVSTLPLNLTSIGAAFLLPLIATYFYVLYSAFSGPVEEAESYA
ncbi:cytochrome d ubiquinol oxidase subunit II [Halobellus sp. Atlit-38R]|jgi:cytochrome d ubiquinol oxidase subunit II|uniref:cytochrome d ubiquinol oxidase subunit II n=1 Tax=Halobellus sp. Atlit-38R TaxID=2282131 RepID=UPI000EF1AAA6|nr:cytochrome d ubiquinol oxidase subunit II [Halobellus sp. Atlit-38R]RLM84028.1 cytochrome d ubiquinol oxidase subunit II [Halobellus sp. Atlit-38R]